MKSRLTSLALFTFALSLTVFKTQSGDVVMYLALARDFIFGSFRGDVDPYLYALPQATLVWTHEWLSYVLFYGAWTLAGAAGLILFKSLILSATFALVLKSDRPPTGLWPGLWLVGITAASFRFVERGSLFSDLGLIILLRWLIAESQMTRGLALRLGALFLLWTQLHPGYPLGLALLGAWTLNRRAWSWWLALPALAPLANPAGWRGYIYPFTFALNEAQTLKHYNFEWFPSYHAAFRWAPETIAYWVFAVISLTLLARARRPREFRTWVCVIALALGAQAVRFIPFAVFATLTALHPWAYLRDVRLPKPLTRAAYALLLVLAFKNSACGYQSSSGPRKPGFGFDPAYFPDRNLELLKTQAIPGRLYASQDFGATLIWQRLTPVFDHGFVTDMDFYRDDVIGALRSPDRFFQLVNKYGWTMLLVEKRNAYPTFYGYLKDRPGWRIVGEDEASYLIYRLP